MRIKFGISCVIPYRFSSPCAAAGVTRRATSRDGAQQTARRGRWRWAPPRGDRGGLAGGACETLPDARVASRHGRPRRRSAADGAWGGDSGGGLGQLAPAGRPTATNGGGGDACRRLSRHRRPARVSQRWVRAPLRRRRPTPPSIWDHASGQEQRDGQSRATTESVASASLYGQCGDADLAGNAIKVTRCRTVFAPLSSLVPVGCAARRQQQIYWQLD